MLSDPFMVFPEIYGSGRIFSGIYGCLGGKSVDKKSPFPTDLFKVREGGIPQVPDKQVVLNLGIDNTFSASE
jgi:hypothetical protein